MIFISNSNSVNGTDLHNICKSLKQSPYNRSLTMKNNIPWSHNQCAHAMSSVMTHHHSTHIKVFNTITTHLITTNVSYLNYICAGQVYIGNVLDILSECVSRKQWNLIFCFTVNDLSPFPSNSELFFNLRLNFIPSSNNSSNYERSNSSVVIS